MEKVSAIVSIYNSEKYLKKLIESVLNQSWKNLEVLLVDDGSTDHSAEICDYYAERHSIIKVIHKTNSGVCDSRNYALTQITGEYCFFVDGDDWLEPDFTEYMMNIIHSTGTQMAISENVFTTRDRKQVVTDNIEVWDSETFIVKLIYPYMKLGPWNKLYAVSEIRKHNIKFPELWFGETLHFASWNAYYCKK